MLQVKQDEFFFFYFLCLFQCIMNNRMFKILICLSMDGIDSLCPKKKNGNTGKFIIR